MTVISLFSGCGGLDLGFIKAGFNVVFANDFDKEAVITYKDNIGDHIVLDSVFNLNSSDIPYADILIGGFPCLGFTLAKGKDRVLECDSNQLFRQYERILNDKNPKFFVVENVVGIKSGKEFNDYFHNEILKAFEKSGTGYNIEYKTLLASDYGVPQNRKRVIIVGVRKDIAFKYSFPEEVVSIKNTLRDAIDDLPRNYDLNIPNHTGNNHKVKITGYVGGRILDWNKPSPTITGRGSRTGGAVIHPHPDLMRRLSIRECARIQSFPDDFIFHGSNSACYAQIGNAVPPIMAFYIANQFRKYFGFSELELNKDDWRLPYV
jgi:DNA (cytosine-5)-methyltransferase 1